MYRTERQALILFTALLLSACGSGDNDSTSTTWEQGVFETAESFKNKCESPRTETNINGEAYPDVAGSALHEKHWLRSWSNETYLWYNEIVDQDIANYSDTIAYFNTLKTFATTDSGNYRDRFHYSQDTAEYELLRSGGASAGYGAKFKLVASSPPREGRIAYIEPNSPASDANLSRGMKIISIDGVDFESGSDTDTINAGLFPKESGEEHTFVVLAPDETTPRTITMNSALVTSSPVHTTEVIETDSGKVGYLSFNTFGITTAEQALVTAFTDLAAEEVTDLILDLRYNGGGYLAISAQLGYMVAGTTLTEGKTYETTVFNDKHPTVNPVTGSILTPIPFFDETIGFSVTKGQALPSLNLNRVYILSSSSTCSASESLINGLRGIDIEVVLIGHTSCGKPYGFYSTDNCGTTYSTIQFHGENAKGFGDYADGFSPNNTTGTVGVRIDGCQVDDDYLHALGDENEAMLKAALDYRVDGSCPPIDVNRSQQPTEQSSLASDLRNDPRIIERELQERIRLDNLRVFGE